MEAGEVDIEGKADEDEEPGDRDGTACSEKLTDPYQQEGKADKGERVAKRGIEEGGLRTGVRKEGDKCTCDGIDQKSQREGSSTPEAGMGSPDAEKGVGIEQRAEGSADQEGPDVQVSEELHGSMLEHSFALRCP